MEDEELWVWVLEVDCIIIALLHRRGDETKKPSHQKDDGCGQMSSNIVPDSITLAKAPSIDASPINISIFLCIQMPIQ